jgi:hypothetical protein
LSQSGRDVLEPAWYRSVFEAGEISVDLAEELKRRGDKKDKATDAAAVVLGIHSARDYATQSRQHAGPATGGERMMKRAAMVAVAIIAAAAAAAMSVEPWSLMIAQAPPAPAASAQPTAPPSQQDAPGFYEGEKDLTPSEIAGREIWYKATAGNARFHTYVLQQRTGILVDWFRALRSDQRDDRFAAYGLINDPGCCIPGAEGCPAKNADETYGFDWCPGDQELLKFVGKAGYRDPACDFRDARPTADHPHHGKKDQRQSSCDLAFGTSTGALGYRKFPNPRFDRERWLKVNGSLGSWEGFRKEMSSDKKSSDYGVRRLADGSIEPPFLIGTSCGSCHIAFDPLNPPRDPARPEWQNIKGAVGNQYLRISELLGSGMPYDSIEYQMFAHARPGTSDTSAIPNDQVSNPGTINALINLHQRPVFEGEDVLKWRAATACPATPAAGTQCWCEPGRDGKCWVHSRAKETVHHILKGGEDSIGALEAVQRVYFNIGSCSEQCWLNHHTDMRQLDPGARNYGQTPFDIGQCRRDCPNFRAIEDRLVQISDFLFSKENHATDLHAARENALKAKDPKARYAYDDLVADLDRQFGKGAVARGSVVFAEKCATCHSSAPDAESKVVNRDFRALDEKTGLRRDWLGNDRATPVSEVGTYRCRALHSNHMAGRLYQEYGSETLRARKPDAGLKEPSDGGRGYYRNISLLSLWAHAPFMHNNAIGPEICGKPKDEKNFFYRSSYVDRGTKALLQKGTEPACQPYDPGVEARFKLYVESMMDLLNPDQRVPKITKLDEPVPLRLGLRRLDEDGKQKQVVGLTIVVPRGTNSAGLVNFQHKSFANDLIQLKLGSDAIEQKLAKALGPDESRQLVTELRAVGRELLKQPEKFVETIRKHPKLIEAYSSCNADIENDGHRFGGDLPDADKKALIAFLATM